jgi:DNA modification methylase
VRAIVRDGQAAKAELARRRDAAAAERLEQKRQLAIAIPAPSSPSALRVFRGDNRQVLPTLQPASVQLVVTSPGYGIGWDYADGGAADALPLDEHQANLTEVLVELKRVLRRGGVLALNLPETIRTLDERAYPLSAWAQLELRRLGFLLREPIVWAHQDAQGHPLAMTTAIGAPSNPYLRRTFERVLVASVDDYAVPNKQQWPADSLEWAKDLWPIGPGHARPGGPLAFPDELVRRLVLLFSGLGDVVLDPFAGTGTTGRLARELGRGAWLVEREPAYWPDLERLQAA